MPRLTLVQLAQLGGSLGDSAQLALVSGSLRGDKSRAAAVRSVLLGRWSSAEVGPLFVRWQDFYGARGATEDVVAKWEEGGRRPRGGEDIGQHDFSADGDDLYVTDIGVLSFRDV